MTENEMHENLDVQALSEAITEINISRNNISIYPRNHPVVEHSLDKAYDRLEKCFASSLSITIAVAKDKLIVEGQAMDIKNHVFHEFALCLNRMNIACVKLSKGLTKDELYSFHSYIISELEDTSSSYCENLWNDHKLAHIKLEFIDYTTFKISGSLSEQEESNESLWENYVEGLLNGTLHSENAFEVIEQIPAEQLAELINASVTDDMNDIQFNEAITAYIEKSLHNSLNGEGLNKLLHVVTGLRTELKKDFLQSIMQCSSENLESTDSALKSMSNSEIINLLSLINENMVKVPDSLSTILNQLSRVSKTATEGPTFNNAVIEDDILLSPETSILLSEKTYSEFVSNEYRHEINNIATAQQYSIPPEETEEYIAAFSDEEIDREFNQIILDLTFFANSIIEDDDYEVFTAILKEQVEQFISTGQYQQALKTLSTIESKLAEQESKGKTVSALTYFRTDQFMQSLTESFRIMGRQLREEVIKVCDYYGTSITPFLLDALTDEESQSVRRFLISLVTHFGDLASPEVLKRLEDKRWFVKRNMLFILLECGSEDSLKQVRKYCSHENPKVSINAVKCLLKANDPQGMSELKSKVRSKSEELALKAIDLIGAFRLTEMVPELSAIYKKKKLKGVDFEYKLHIVRALSLIGDDYARSTLTNLLSAKSIFYKAALERLKEEACRYDRKNAACKTVPDIQPHSEHDEAEGSGRPAI